MAAITEVTYNVITAQLIVSHILWTLYETLFFSKLLHLHVKFCSGFHWFNPFCFTAALWHKRCFLFLFFCLQKFRCTFRSCKYLYRCSKLLRYVRFDWDHLPVPLWDYACIYFIFFHPSGSIVAMILMDKLGRRVLLLGSFSGMVISLVLFQEKSLWNRRMSW